MLEITIPGEEWFDEVTNEFRYTEETHLTMEHSLVSLSKWESKWQKPFLGRESKTGEEVVDYYRCMTITRNVDPGVFARIPTSIQNQIWEYINGKHTATTVREDNDGPPSRRIITAEVIYYWMIAANVPFECERWNLDKLLTLIEVCNAEQSGSSGQKLSPKQLAQRNRNLNAQRRAAAHSHG